MHTINLDHPEHIHFIGIGGISMSGLASILLSRKFTVTGSDRTPSALTEELEAKGAHIIYGQKAENITEGIDCVVYTAAIHPDNPEYAAAKSMGIAMLSRAELLGQMMKFYGTPICVSGTHGKTTTTSIAAHILLAAHKDPTISVGGILPLIGGNIRVGGQGTFLMEACEYTNSFLSFFPKVAIILDVDADHLDFFKDLADIRHSFRLFAEKVPADGTLIINADDPAYRYLSDALSCSVLSYSMSGREDADYTAKNITFDTYGCASFTALKHGRILGSFTLKIPGEHNVANCLAAIAMADLLGINAETIQEGLNSFHGTDRRFQLKGHLNGATVVDDYAHHPTEIRATLKTALKYPHKKLWVVFQSHTYSRTKMLMKDFADALSMADEVILPDIFPAREKQEDFGITSRDLQAEIRKLGTDCRYNPSFEAIEDFLRSNVKEGDLVITMGAGNVNRIAEAIV
ncbi:MAG: UDP-N-acetylmuramate--L-alanine ligase [Eubacterium sp.]|nr:UDP-N-acetylmuramate--L-alanine ligase [Eubacterium sp.]